jgi:leucyl-tRNA synthetase
MFPYPSGSGLHIGHWYNYSIVDSYCKVQRYQGKEIFQPFGYDAFGLPAENYARKVGRDPREVTEENIHNFRKEMERMNTGFVEKLVTSSSEYVKRTQRLFSLMLEHDMAYKAKRFQDFCPSCETVLAKEQARGGRCERCGSETEKREIEQWFFRITRYRDRLVSDLEKVDYPESTKRQQIHWLENLTDWSVSRQRKWGCPIPVEGETDTLDTFVDSSFYTIEYDSSRPVDIYVGGSEHACMHLIYARFVCKFLYDIGEISFDEPFRRVVHQGMILGEDGEKMSKTRGNVIDPSGYDPQLLRMYLMFINHYFEGGRWKDDGYWGCQKFRKRLLNWLDNPGEEDTEIAFQEFEEKAISFFEAWKTNRVVSEWMIFYNSNKTKKPSKKQAEKIRRFFEACF